MAADLERPRSGFVAPPARNAPEQELKTGVDFRELPEVTLSPDLDVQFGLDCDVVPLG
jgi:hypothetical protein